MSTSRLKPVQARGLAVMAGLLVFALVTTDSRSQETPRIPVPGKIGTWQELKIKVRKSNAGARVSQVSPDSPTLKLKRISDGAPYKLLVGDVITHVNGCRVFDAFDISAALQLKDGEAELWILDLRDRSHQKFRCRTIVHRQ